MEYFIVLYNILKILNLDRAIHSYIGLLLRRNDNPSYDILSFKFNARFRLRFIFKFRLNLIVWVHDDAGDPATWIDWTLTQLSSKFQWTLHSRNFQSTFIQLPPDQIITWLSPVPTFTYIFIQLLPHLSFTWFSPNVHPASLETLWDITCNTMGQHQENYRI